MADPQTLPLILRYSLQAGYAPPKSEFTLNTFVINRADGKLYWLSADGNTVNSMDRSQASFAKLASPQFTGTPTAPTPALYDSSTALATTRFVTNTAVRFDVIQNLLGASKLAAKKNVSVEIGRRYYTGQPNNMATLSQADLGSVVYLESDITGVKVPLAANYTDGDYFWIYCRGTALIQATAGDPYTFGFGDGLLSSFTMLPGDRCKVVMNGDAWGVLSYTTRHNKALMADRSLSFSDAEKRQLLANIDIANPLFQCRLVWTSATQISLVPCRGNKVWIDGTYRTLPVAVGGIGLSNAGLAANTIYYIYAFWNGSSIQLIASTNPAVNDTVYGIKIPSGTPSYSYVGKVTTNANAQYQDDPGYRGVLTAHNKRLRALRGAGGTYSTSSQSAVELSTAARAYFLADDETTALLEMVTGSGGAGATSPGYAIYAWPSMDGSNASPSGMGGNAAYGNCTITAGFTEEPNEAWHYVTIKGQTQGAYTASVNGAVVGLVMI